MKTFDELTLKDLEELNQERVKALGTNKNTTTLSQVKSFYNTRREIKSPNESSNGNSNLLLG